MKATSIKLLKIIQHILHFHTFHSLLYNYFFYWWHNKYTVKHSVQRIKDICWRSIKWGNIRNNITLFANVLSFLSKMQLCNLLIKMCNSPGIRRNEIETSSIPESRFTMRFFEAVRWVNQFESLPDITQAINQGVMHKFYKVGKYLV